MVVTIDVFVVLTLVDPDLLTEVGGDEGLMEKDHAIILLA